MASLLQTPFFQITLPLMFTFIGAIWVASWSQNKRFDDVNRRLDSIDKRLDRIDSRLTEFGERITRLEERTSPLHR